MLQEKVIRFGHESLFFWVEASSRTTKPRFNWLLKEGVIVRPMTSFGMESCLRVTVGTPEENRRFAKALKKVLAGAKSP